MTVKSAQSITIDFTTTNPATGAAADATGTPAGTLVVNGTDNGATVTVTNKATGVYKAAVTLPSLTAGDMVQIRIAATVATVAGVGVVWTDVADTARLSDISAKTDSLPAAPASTTNITAGTMTTVTNLTNLPAAAALEATLTAMKGAGWTTQTLVSIAAQITGLPATLSYDIIEAMIREDSGYAIGDIVSGSVVDIVRDTIRGADNDTLKTLSDQIDGVSAGSGLTAQQTRDAMMLAPTAGAPAAGSVDAHLDDILEDTGTTLPASIAAISQIVDNNTTDATAAGSITRRRGDSWAIQLTVGNITGYTSLWFTARGDRDAADTASVLQVKKNASGTDDGLLYVNATVAATAGLGSITVSDASTGAIIITVDEAVTDDLSPAEIYYDVQVLNGGNVTTLDLGTLTITADVTRAIL